MTDNELKNLIIEDPEKGLNVVKALYGGAFKTICQNILRDFSNEDIEEALSDALTAIWECAPRYRSDENSSFKSFSYGIVRRTALSKRRKCLREKAAPLTEGDISLKESCSSDGPAAFKPLLFAEGVSSPSTEEAFFKKEARRLLHEAVSELSEPCRSVFILRYFYLYKVKEIAEKLNISYKKVENCLFRGKKKLYEKLKDLI